MALIDIAQLGHFLKRLHPHIHYSTVCETEASAAVKEVYIPKFETQNGSRVTIFFQNANTANAPKLKINDEEAKNIVVSVNNQLVPLSASQASLLTQRCEMLCDGEKWVVLSVSDKAKNQIVYGEDEPTDPFQGMIWLKPAETVTEETPTGEKTTEEKLADALSEIEELNAQIALLQAELNGEGEGV